MKLSKLASEIAESPTLALNEEARLLRERGEAVIHLGIGEPKNKTPINAILSSAAKLTSGEVKYTPADGVPSLKKAILRYTEENYNRLAAPENVIVTNGAKQSLFNIFYSILNPQDEVMGSGPRDWDFYFRTFVDAGVPPIPEAGQIAMLGLGFAGIAGDGCGVTASRGASPPGIRGPRVPGGHGLQHRQSLLQGRRPDHPFGRYSPAATVASILP